MIDSKLSKIKSFDPSAAAKNPIPYDPKRVRSGPGALGEFMAQESKVFAENSLLKAELEIVKSQDSVIRIDPKQIKPSRLANRLPINFQTDEFDQLKQDILKTQGNIQPIKVRPVDGSKDEFEIVYGHRRHKACLELGMLVSAIVVKEMTERQQFCEMEMENQSRLNVSAYEQGLNFKHVLELGIYKNASEIIEDVGLSKSTVSKLLTLANFPSDLIEAFKNPTEIQFSWIERLNKAISKNAKAVIGESKKIKAEFANISSSEVLARLIKAASESKRKLNGKQIEFRVKLLNDCRSARVSLDNLPEDEVERQLILDKLNSFLKTI